MIRNAIAVGLLSLALAGCEGLFADPRTVDGAPASTTMAQPMPGPLDVTMLDLETAPPLPPAPLPKHKPPLRHDEVIELQSALQLVGYDPGPIDGLLGLRTLAAVRAYQSATGLPVDGSASYALLLRLRDQVRTTDRAGESKRNTPAKKGLELAAGKAQPHPPLQQSQTSQKQQKRSLFSRIFGPLFEK